MPTIYILIKSNILKMTNNYPTLSPPFTEQLLLIAKEDLESSKILYQHGKWPQSIFFLQQAVEKSYKSIAMFQKYIDASSMKGEVGHNPLNILKMQIDQFESLKYEFINKPDAFESIVSLCKHIGYDYTSITDELKNNKNDIESFIKSCSKINLTEDQLDDCLSEITAYLRKREILIKDIQTDLRTLINQENSELLTSLTGLTAQIMYELIGSFQILTPLSIIITSHEQKSRYPDEKSGFNPLTYYTKDSLLIKRLPQMQKYSGVVIEWMDEIYSFMEILLSLFSSTVTTRQTSLPDE